MRPRRSHHHPSAGDAQMSTKDKDRPADTGVAPGTEEAGSTGAARRSPRPRGPRPRKASAGDTAPALSEQGIERFEVDQAVAAAEDAKAIALADIMQTALTGNVRSATEALGALMEGASADEVELLRKALLRRE